MLKPILVAATLLWTGTAVAEEVIIEKERPAASSTTTVEKHGPDCDSKTVHSENAEGDSKTVTHQECD